MVKEQAIILEQVQTGYVHGNERRLLASIPKLEFAYGEFVAIVGLNGVGKSTLLRSMAGLQSLLSGNVLIAGKDMRRMPALEISRHLAIVLTEKVSGFNLRVLEAVAAGQMPYTGMFHQLREENMIHVHHAIARCGLEGHEDRLLNELSDGMLQRTMIARALAQNTKILLLDEPTAFIDFAAGHTLFSSLQKIAHEEDKCIVLTTHDLPLALKYCDKLMIMEKDHCALIETASALADPAFQRLSGGFL